MRLALHVVLLSTSSGVKRSHVIITAFTCPSRQIDSCCLKVAIFREKEHQSCEICTLKGKKLAAVVKKIDSLSLL